jgi:hypothetical protein
MKRQAERYRQGDTGGRGRRHRGALRLFLASVKIFIEIYTTSRLQAL